MGPESTPGLCVEWNLALGAGFLLLVVLNITGVAVWLLLGGYRRGRKERGLAGLRRTLADLAAIRDTGHGVRSTLASVLVPAMYLWLPAALLAAGLFAWGSLGAIHTCS